MKRICLVLENLRQRGQALVELAFTLPLFLMMFFCIVYGGWVFTDYMTFSNIARDCTHKAVNIQTEDIGAAVRDYASGNGKYYTLGNMKDTLHSDLFVWDPSKAKYLYAEEKSLDKDGSIVVTVHLRAGLDTNNSNLGQMVYNLMELCSGSEKAAKTKEDFIVIDYSMYKENTDENTSK